jgi:2-aminoadipate transaminase
MPAVGHPRLATLTRSMPNAGVRATASISVDRPLLSMAGGLPPSELFPYDELARAAQRLLGSKAASALAYTPTAGDQQLRELVVGHLRVRVGLDSMPSQAVVTAGSQQALDLIAKVLLDPGDVAVVETPTYVGALRTLGSYQAAVVAVPSDEDGIDTHRLDEMLRGGLRPKLCYVVPNFSNPTGATLSAERRRHLRELAERHGFVVVEDDPYGLLRFEGSALAPIAGHSELVVYVTSFSKLIAPGLRVGCLVAPDWLVEAVVPVKQATDLSSSSLSQHLVADRLADGGWLDHHIGVLREAYRVRATALLESIDRRLAGRLRVTRPEGGMFVWASITQPDLPADQVASACRRHGVGVMPGTAYSIDGRYGDALRLSFAELGPAELDDAVARMAVAFDELATEVAPLRRHRSSEEEPTAVDDEGRASDVPGHVAR